MDRQSLDAAARELLGRPLTDDEAAFVGNACVAMGLGEGDITVRLLIVHASMMTFLARTLATVESSRAPSTLLRRHRGLAIGSIVSVAVLITGAFGLGQASVTARSHRDIEQTLRWSLSPEGQRARRMSEMGLLEALENCAIPGWTLDGEICSPGPDPQTGGVRGIRTRFKP
ncbi:MAG: hypothetical protein DI537_02390 [Stutzerimonas stutzeri]|nr:MAG: hypothetical protein DI537_02390 [Stutzerimonas stutzeri]